MKSILITGVSTGLGRALLLKAHAEGWRVIGTSRDDAAVAADGLPGDIALYRLEPRFPHAVHAFSERLLAEHGAPDVIVNNAAFAPFGPVEEMTAESLAELFQVNVFAPVGLTSAMLPAMRERGSGTIVNVTSIGGRVVFPFFTSYNATKHALEAFSEGLWHELKPFGIRVKVIEPGYIDTPIYRTMQGAKEPTGPYAHALGAMRAFADGVKKRSTPEQAAEETWRAVVDPGDRLRYPVAAYGRSLLALRALIGGETFMRLMHDRWMESRR